MPPREFLRPLRYSRQVRCRNCGILTISRMHLCPWCRKAGKWGVFFGSLLAGLIYNLVKLAWG